MVGTRTDSVAHADRAPGPGPAHVRRPLVARDTWQMGFNPDRQHRRSPWDVVFVGAALAVAAALVLWAFLG